MNERDLFLKAIAANEDDAFPRLVFADWLEERGEYEEAERQRRMPEARKLFAAICRDYNAAHPNHQAIGFRDLLIFGVKIMVEPGVEVEVTEDIPHGYGIANTIKDRIPDFWRAWSVVSGQPLVPEIERKCYYATGYCCAHDVSPDTLIAGPMSERFRAEEEERERHQRELDREEEDARRRLAEEADEAGQRRFDLIREELEKDRR